MLIMLLLRQITIIPSEYIEEEYELYRKYQINVHKESADKITPASYSSFLVETPLIVSSFSIHFIIYHIFLRIFQF
jgi:arginyl-tRNA--protein-N-Asp/Glu arginylyltransferase